MWSGCEGGLGDEGQLVARDPQVPALSAPGGGGGGLGHPRPRSEALGSASPWQRRLRGGGDVAGWAGRRAARGGLGRAARAGPSALGRRAGGRAAARAASCWGRARPAVGREGAGPGPPPPR